MENNNIWSKLDYIRDLNRRKSTNCQNTIRPLQEHTEYEIETNSKIIHECFSFSLAKIKNQSNKEIEIEKIEVLKKKLNIAKGYLNLVLFTLSLKYLDIIIRVKYGGIIFSFGCLYIFYSSNKKFSECSNSLLLKELAKMSQTSTKNMLDQYLKAKNLQSDEEKLRKITLKKYWKEPMAWH